VVYTRKLNCMVLVLHSGIRPKLNCESHNDVVIVPSVRDKDCTMLFFHYYSIKVEFLPNKHA